MYRILPLLGDVGLGILTIVYVSHQYAQNGLEVFLFLPFIFLPDLDAVGEIQRKGHVGASSLNPYDHRDLLHKPLPWLLVAWGGVLINEFYGVLIFWLILVHFLHDSVLTGWGVSWLWPISNDRIKLFSNYRNENSCAPRDLFRIFRRHKLQGLIMQYGDDRWISHLYLRPTVVSIVEYGTFLISIVALVQFLSP